MKKNIKINRILVITLSNLGDVILTTPVIKTLKKNIPNANICVLCSEYVNEIFKNDPNILETFIYRKHLPIFKKIKFAFFLKTKNFDMVVDLRHTLFPLIIRSVFRTSFLDLRKKSDLQHKVNWHLNRLKTVNYKFSKYVFSPYIYIPEKTKKEVDIILKNQGYLNSSYAVISPGGRTQSKLWPKEKFLELINKINRDYGYKIILTGNSSDRIITDWIEEKNSFKILNLAGKTNILQLAEIIKRAGFLLTNDSGVLHVGSAVDTPVISLFGPTNEFNYGPLSDNSSVITSSVKCRPCGHPKCSDYKCMQNITVEEVYSKIKFKKFSWKK